MAVRFVGLFFESSLLQLFQAVRADKVFRVELSEHCSYAATCCNNWIMNVIVSCYGHFF